MAMSSKILEEPTRSTISNRKTQRNPCIYPSMTPLGLPPGEEGKCLCRIRWPCDWPFAIGELLVGNAWTLDHGGGCRWIRNYRFLIVCRGRSALLLNYFLLWSLLSAFSMVLTPILSARWPACQDCRCWTEKDDPAYKLFLHPINIPILTIILENTDWKDCIRTHLSQ